ncbi:MAG TPA: ABC transporter ATP-binding protein [Bacillota bacterium]|nr:ABC transporter ATP-binding protein [Bacillota bacterium]
MSSLLEIRGLEVSLGLNGKAKRVIDGIDILVGEREVVGIVGESGCGKSMTALSIMGLLPHKVGRVTGGEIYFRGAPLSHMNSHSRRLMRGRDVAMIFQEPMTSLNPVLSIGRQLSETVMLHRKLGRRQAWERGIEMLGLVGVSNPSQRMNEYPHQLSGGMRQRVMIAMALSCEPALLIADEPTTALDVTIQAQVLELIRRLGTELGMAILLITHDLGVIAEMADRVVVMYLGQVVEEGKVGDIFAEPLHPYTCGLLRSVPRIDADLEELYQIPGSVPDLGDIPAGCRFAPRCEFATCTCAESEPPLVNHGKRQVRCWHVAAIHHQEAMS